jgi:hypothetical protein
VAAGGHGGRERPDQDERCFDVDVVDSVDVLVPGVRGRAEGEDPGVVHEDVDVPAAEFGGLAGQGPY